MRRRKPKITEEKLYTISSPDLPSSQNNGRAVRIIHESAVSAQVEAADGKGPLIWNNHKALRLYYCKNQLIEYKEKQEEDKSVEDIDREEIENRIRNLVID